jgi:hypothetical protein
MEHLIQFKEEFWIFEFDKGFNIESGRKLNFSIPLEKNTIFFLPNIDKIEDLTSFDIDLKFEWDGKWGLIDCNFNILIPPIYQSIEWFNKNLLIVSKWDETIEFYDLTDDDFDCNYFYENFLFGIIDMNNSIIIPIKYTYIRPELSGNNLIVMEGGNWKVTKTYQDEINIEMPNGKFKSIDFTNWLS